MIQTTINGVPHQFDDLHPDDTAIDLIRERVGLTGTKLVCGGGVCGACTVLVDGTPMTSCLLPAHHLDGRTVQTVEAHGRENLHPVQRAFMACDALQCGFCTPGYINGGIAFYERWRAENGATTPTREQVAHALAGHLCRCGAYVGIYDAMQRACAGEFDEPAGHEALESPRHEALEKVTGAAQYTVDITHDGQLEGRILRSHHAHARVVSIDPSAALAMDGVDTFVELLESGRTVRYVGQPIGAIAARDTRTANAALAAIHVEYEVHPPVITMEDAQADDAPVLYEGWRKSVPTAAEGFTLPGTWNGNTRHVRLKLTSRQTGKARRTVERAPTSDESHVIRRTFRNAAQSHTALEPHACIARWDGPDRLAVHASSQNIHLLRKEIADHFDLENEQVEVSAAHIGGGFGGKQGLYAECIAAITLARRANRPVRVACDRLEELSYAGLRPANRNELALAVDADGTPQALTLRSYGNAGVAIGSLTAGLMGFVTNMPRDLEQFDVVTNTPPGKPFRGPDGPQAFWALEQAIDDAAHALNMDPLAVRRTWDRDNAVRTMLYDWVETLPVWQERGAVGRDTGRFRRGVGMSTASWLFLYNPNTKVKVSATPAGIAVETATQDIGSGTRTVLARVIEEVFGIPRRDVIVRIGSSAAPIGPMSGGSQVTNSVYGPARAAAEQVLAQLLEAAQSQLGLRNVGPSAAGVTHSDGVLPWPDLLGQVEPIAVTEGRGAERGPLGLPLRMPGGADDPSIGLRLSHAVTITELEVDARLGKITPRHVWSGVAAGRIFVPPLARSQVYGGVIQGLGYALYEAKEYDRATGHNLTANLEEYKIPGLGDTPPIDVHFLEEGYEEIRGGGMGMAELVTVGVAASVGNAVFHATGWRPRNTPILPHDVLAGIQEMQTC